MRTMHDGILVGVGTAVADDPRLNGECRLVSGYAQLVGIFSRLSELGEGLGVEFMDLLCRLNNH